MQQALHILQTAENIKIQPRQSWLGITHSLMPRVMSSQGYAMVPHSYRGGVRGGSTRESVGIDQITIGQVSVRSQSVRSRFGRVPSRHSDGTPRHTYVDRYESVRGCLSPSHASRNHGGRNKVTHPESIEAQSCRVINNVQGRSWGRWAGIKTNRGRARCGLN